MAQINIQANGKITPVDEGKSIEAFLLSLNMSPQRCVVEINGKAKRFSEFAEIVLQDGDVLEVMTIVAGG